jgi:hypothetical protein
MLTQNEITALSLSPTKKDFVQIWNELLEVAGKLSERWDPTSTNESDPGIVLLKALTGIADKLNYTIDKNILEAFMPTAAQEDSMRKLCDMLGYNMKYYRSAETEVTVKYHSSDPDDDEELKAMTNANAGYGQILPKFTVITNSDKDISYFTTRQSNFIHPTKSSSVIIPCMEGQIVKCESSNDNNVITVNQISENNRFYLPETMIAENGIFIYNATIEGNTLVDGERWTRVDNLNTQSREARVFKFGYDSYESRPYIEFPADYSKLFNDGIFLYYARTSGINGNVSPRTLTQIELPTTGTWSNIKASSFNVENIVAATSGANVETIKQAYNNFKKTVGTFETLVTCRDYMNKIYSLIVNGKPLVSNILVTDIRNDLNKAVTICSCDDAGIFYKEVPLSSNIPVSESTKPVFSGGSWHLGNASGIILPNTNSFVDDSNFEYAKTGEAFVKEGYWYIKQEKSTTEVVECKTTLQVGSTEQAISNFDIVFYPYKLYNQIRSNVKDIRTVYDNSFKYSEDNFDTIKQELLSKDIKTISHNIKKPDIGDVLSINNYLRLSATIATNTKVTTDEGAIIIDRIKIALANAFNMRELDFGDEIPFDSIVEVIENADTRIKVASLNEPALYTTFSVLERRDADNNNKPVIVEYAVASNWLDVDTANATGKFDIKNIHEDNTGKIISFTSDTFDSKKAREIYNKLAVRNVLAGRVPLFNYNNSFTSSFSEATYQTTTHRASVELPSYVTSVYGSNPDRAIWTENGIIYTAQYEGDLLAEATETAAVYPNNLITEDTSDDRIDNYITDIKGDCKLRADESGVITDVTLVDGEFVKFRAPNFITVKTYPAYVNYHLELAGATKSEAVPAEAESLLNILNTDLSDYSETNTDIKWQRVLNYFAELDEIQGHTSNNDSYRKTFRLEQIVSAYSETEEKPTTSTITTIGVELENNQVEDIGYTPEQLMALSGCVKLKNEGFKANLTWVNDDGTELLPAESAKFGNINDQVEVKLSDFTSPFITNINVLSAIKTSVDNALNTYRNQLPRDCAWKVSFEFECVPFEAASLEHWIKFISYCAKKQSFRHQILGTRADGDKNITFWKPIEENGTILWRIFGDGYDIGKYVTKNTEKLLPFTTNYFGLLPDTRLSGIYLIKNIGSDATPTVIKNDEEYQLKSGECLYIEYTPSTTTEEGTSQTANAITECYEEGTIIRPSGFEVGLVDSDNLQASSYKTVKFSTTDHGIAEKTMYSLGANEQIEIRDFARVSITNEDFPVIWVYKNFNGCPELENKNGNAEGSRKYTLKDGEAIFYTDQNKSEFAYYTTGTTVELTGMNFTIGEFDVVELTTILDSGLQEIPWERKVLKPGDEITFTEYQYITLGAEDTLDSMVVIEAEEDSIGKYLDVTWKECSDVEYTLASDPDTRITLPKINLQDSSDSNGWEANCTLELNAAPNVAQTLRNTAKVETSLTLTRTSTTGGTLPADPNDIMKTVKPKESYSGVELPLSFKTNLACQACGNEININDVWSNPDNLKGFQLKVFVADTPALVETESGTIMPYDYTGALALWTGTPLAEKEYLELWNQISLDDIKPTAEEDKTCDNALRLPISLLPNTYGIFSIYVNYSASSAHNGAKTWVEVIPGTDTKDVELLNDSSAKYEFIAGTNNTKLSRLYLNPGINCIRVNTNTKLFIKASSEAKGTLHFDELQLVNSMPIKYISPDNNQIVLNTKGLNITQLGYLDTATDAKESLTTIAKEKLQEAYVEDLYTKSNEAVRQSEEKFATEYHKLTELLPKVRALVATEKLIAEELDAIKALDDTRFSELAQKYKEVSDTLDKERALLNALDNNTKTDSLEAQLVDLLDSFTSIDSKQQQILAELKVLCDKAKAASANISNETILADFTEAASIEKEKALPELKTAIASQIEERYQAQLNIIANGLDNSVNSTGNATLAAILEKLRDTTTAKTRAELQTKINKLANVVETNVTSLTEELVDLVRAPEPDFTVFLERLAELRNSVASTGIKALVSEIERVAEEENDLQLRVLLSPLFSDDEFDINALDAILSSDVVSLIDELVAEAKAETVNIPNIRKKAVALHEDIVYNYTTELTEIFITLRSTVDKLFTEITSLDKILADLSKVTYEESNSSSQIKLAISQLEASIRERTTLVNALGNLTIGTIGSNACKQFINDAVVAVWPVYMQARTNGLLADITAAFERSLKSEAEKVAKNTLTDIYSSETSTIKLLIDTAAFEALFDKIKPMLSISEQTNIDIEAVREISGLLFDSYELSTVLDAYSTANNANKVIKVLLSQWYTANNANDVRQKQKVQIDLRDALTKAIDTQERLFIIISDILCPELTKAINNIDETDSFYDNMALKLTELRTAIKNCNNNLSIAVDNDYLTLLEQPISGFKSALLRFNVTEASLLPNECDLATIIESLITANDQTNDVITLETKQLSTLSSVELRALVVANARIQEYLDDLCIKIEKLEQLILIDTDYETAFKTLKLEDQLLEEIKAIDVNREFYYNAPVSSSFALDLNESISSQNTLMNPQMNYDVNNINNSFVISKLDIDFLDQGIQIARSSRLN